MLGYHIKVLITIGLVLAIAFVALLGDEDDTFFSRSSTELPYRHQELINRGIPADQRPV